MLVTRERQRRERRKIDDFAVNFGQEITNFGPKLVNLGQF